MAATFPPEARLRRPEDFKAVLASGSRLHESPMTFVVAPNRQGSARLGLAIAARSVPTAVGRNRIKRIARDSFRRARSTLTPVDVVVLAKPAAASAATAQLRKAFDTVWRRLQRGAA